MNLAVCENERFRLRIVPSDYNPRDNENLGVMACNHRRFNLGDKKAMNTELYSSWKEWLENEVLVPHGGEKNVVYLPLYLLDHSVLKINTTGFGCPWDSGQVGWIYATKEIFRAETGYTDNELFNPDRHRFPDIGEHVRIKDGKDWGKVCSIINGKTLKINFDYDKIPSCRKLENIINIEFDDQVEVMADIAKQILKLEVEEYNHYLAGRVYGYILETRKVCANCGKSEYQLVDSLGGFVGGLNGMREHFVPEALPLLERAMTEI